MKTQKAHIRRIALLLTLAYFALSGSVMIQSGVHAAVHDHSPKHAAAHASFVCTWMCTASSFVHSADPRPSEGVRPSFETLAVHTEPDRGNISAFSFYIRPPPVSVS